MKQLIIWLALIALAVYAFQSGMLTSIADSVQGRVDKVKAQKQVSEETYGGIGKTVKYKSFAEYIKGE
ncbi:hypothetical protein II906_03660 [bacterium]|nr:hypothetical protein [bacterium]